MSRTMDNPKICSKIIVPLDSNQPHKGVCKMSSWDTQIHIEEETSGDWNEIIAEMIGDMEIQEIEKEWSDEDYEEFLNTID